jgi:hypothetical protein
VSESDDDSLSADPLYQDRLPDVFCELYIKSSCNHWNPEERTMALLNVATIAEDINAAPGNSVPATIVASVTDAAGVAVTGLTTANFAVATQIVGPGGAIVTLSTVTSSTAGFYNLQVVPLTGNTWKSGVYIFGVAVTHGSDRGQALSSFLLD